jgi:hypothetical protein
MPLVVVISCLVCTVCFILHALIEFACCCFSVTVIYDADNDSFVDVFCLKYIYVISNDSHLKVDDKADGYADIFLVHSSNLSRLNR